MALSGGIKLVLVLCAIAVAGVLLMVAGGWYWWTQHSRDFFESSRTVMDEGRTAGRRLDEPACLALAIDRHRRQGSNSMTAAVRNNLWLAGCLETSRPQPRFCEGVPSYESPVAVGAWAGLACAQQGISDPYCGNLYSNVAKYCSSSRREDRMPGTRKG